MFNLVGFLKGLLIQDPADRSKQLNLQISSSATTGTATTIIAAQTANRNITLPDGDGELITADSTTTLTNKTIDGDNNTLQDISLASLKTVLSDANKFIARNGSGAAISTNTVPTGTVVGTSDTQTLTNKSMSGSSNTFTNIPTSGIAAMPANTVIGNVTGSSAVPTNVPATQFSQVTSVVVRDSNANVTANNYLAGLQATSNSGGTTTFLVNSAENQVFFGSGNQTVVLPSALTLSNGQSFMISNESTGIVTLKDGSSATIQTMAAHSHATVIVTNTSSAAGVWDVNYTIPVDASGNLTGAASATIANVTIGIGGLTEISTTGSSALFLTNSGPSNQLVFTDKPFQINSPQVGLAGQLIMREDQANGASTLTIQPAASMASNRTVTFPDASGIAMLNPMTTGGDVIYGAASGTPARLANGTAGQVLTSSGGTTAPSWNTNTATAVMAAPTLQSFLTAGSGTYNKNYTFIITSGNATVGDTYTNNSITFTVYATVASSTQVVMSGSGAPTAFGALTRTSGSGDLTLNFSQVLAPLYLKVTMAGGGGGGSGGGTGTSTSGGPGGNTTFGTSLLTANGGSGGVASATQGASSGGAGGSSTIASPARGLALTGGYGSGAAAGGSSASVVGMGGTNALGGAGAAAGINASTGHFGSPNTGAGGGGGGSPTSGTGPGAGGGAGGYISALIPNPLATYSFAVGAAGGGGAPSSSGGNGASGGIGVIIVEEHYQ